MIFSEENPSDVSALMVMYSHKSDCPVFSRAKNFEYEYVLLGMYTDRWNANTPSTLKEFATESINGALWIVFTEVQL